MLHYMVLTCLLATGDGDQIMQFCPSFHIVQLMREGLSAEEACLKVVSRMKESCHNKDFEAAVIATDKKVSEHLE